ncbi:MAG: tRNA lysidine(34) synthetase TilS [Peptostreptococcaceae bacterium]|jgi:tRNA(Ile)-lysidine synthase|nr:tRNA lysidine(34) synthetase TilS [Peptostreptococcaceae bacterium]
MIKNIIKQTIKRENLIDKNDKIIIALSGGPDSVALLHALNSLKDELQIKLYAAHLNHQIRGIEAQKDALYTMKICEELGITCFVSSKDAIKYSKENKLSLEEGARKLRYDMFFELKEKLNANKIAIAHNKDDQSETFLMRVIRGTGLDGLKGIRYKREDGIIRPLLDVDRESIEKYCEDYKLNPRIDKTNLENIYTRNKIRLDLIPYIEEHFNSNLKSNISRLCNMLYEDSNYINTKAKECFDRVKNEDNKMIKFKVDNIKNLDYPIKSRVIRLALKKFIVDLKGIEYIHIDNIIKLLNGEKGQLIDIKKGIKAFLIDDEIIFSKELIKKDIEKLNVYNLPKSGFIKIKELNALLEIKSFEKGEEELKSDKYTKYFDLDKISSKLVLRPRENGDRIKMLNSGTKKIKDLFIDMKIEKEKRELIPIISDDKGILWVVGYKMSDDYKIEDDTKNILKLFFKKLS